MQKVEFPTFLNERPTIIFGRTGRELLIIAIGLASTYITWLRINSLFHSSTIGAIVLKGAVAALPSILGGVVAFVKVLTRPLEEWAFIWLFYFLIPKVHIYMPFEESNQIERAQDDRQESAVQTGEEGL